MRNVGGLGKYVICHTNFFSSFFCFLQRTPRSNFLTDRHDMPKRVFPAKDVSFGVSTILDYIYGVKPSKTSPKWAGIGISKPNQRSSKIGI